MTDKQINKWLRRRFTTVGWTLVGYFALINILVMAVMASDMLIQQLRFGAAGEWGRETDMNAIAGNAWGYILAIAVALIILHGWKGPDYWKTEILLKEKSMTSGTFFSVLSLCIGFQFVNMVWIMCLELMLNLFGLSALGIMEDVSGASNTFSMFLYASLLAPISEELLFRGFVLRSLRPYGKRFAIFGSAVLFGLFHGNLLQTPYAFLVGLVLGYVTVEYSVVWAIVLHVFNNLVVADLLTRLTAGLPEVLIGAVNLLLFGSFAVASVVMLIQKKTEIAAYRRSEWIDRRCIACFFSNSGVIVLSLIMLINMIALIRA